MNFDRIVKSLLNEANYLSHKPTVKTGTVELDAIAADKISKDFLLLQKEILPLANNKVKDPFERIKKLTLARNTALNIRNNINAFKGTNDQKVIPFEGKKQSKKQLLTKLLNTCTFAGEDHKRLESESIDEYKKLSGNYTGFYYLFDEIRTQLNLSVRGRSRKEETREDRGERLFYFNKNREPIRSYIFVPHVEDMNTEDTPLRTGIFIDPLPVNPKTAVPFSQSAFRGKTLREIRMLVGHDEAKKEFIKQKGSETAGE